jgi:putative ABC transport system substrate-binding protein
MPILTCDAIQGHVHKLSARKAHPWAQTLEHTEPIGHPLGIFTDPVGQGLVQTLARPGGNVTAISLAPGTESVGKWLELLRLIVPTLRRVGDLYNPDNPGHVANLGELRTLAPASGLEVLPAATRSMADLDVGFESVVAGGAEALIVGGYGQAEGTTRISALALSHHLVTLGVNSSQAAEGLLSSYSVDYTAMYRRGGCCVDRILKGACVTKSRRRYRGRRSNLTEAGCIRDGGWPSEVALQGETPNHRKLRRSRAGVVSVTEKVAPRVWQVRAKKANASEPLMTCESGQSPEN